MLETECAFLFYYFYSKGFLEFLVDWREDPKRFGIGTPLIAICLFMQFLYLIVVMNFLAVWVVLFVRFKV